MSAVNAQEESVLDFLKKIDGIVDSIVMIGKTTTTTTKLSTTVRKKMVKLFLNHPHRGILKKILHLEAFTLFILESMLDKTKNEIYPTIRILLGLGIIDKSKTMKVSGGPHVVIYLVRGGDINRVFDAQKLHFELMPRGTVTMMGRYIDESLLDSIIMGTEKVSLGRVVKQSVVTELVKEKLGVPLNYTLVLDTLSHFKERGWRVED